MNAVAARRKWGFGIACAAGLTLAACHPASKGAFDPHGYLNEDFGYRVLGDNMSILDGNWQLDNFYRNPDARIEQKSSDGYVAEYELDTNGDGEPDAEQDFFLYDLRFKHRTHDAAVWLRTFPVSTDLREKDLRVLMLRYVEQVSGTGYEAASVGAPPAGGRRYAATIREQGQGTVAGLEAYATTLDVSNAAQDRMTPGQHRTRVRLVLMRTPFTFAVTEYSGAERRFPVMMLAGYANLPEDFDHDLGGFQTLLDRIEIKGHHGVSIKLTPIDGAPAPAAATPAVAVAPPPPPPAQTNGAPAPAAATPAVAVAPPPSPPAQTNGAPQP